MTLQFELASTSDGARAGRVTMARGSFDTPVFMPVGTHATVKSLTSEEIEQLGAEIILCNAYHLALRPGAALIGRLGGLHRFMGWPHLVLTDSGGFQIFSLRSLMRIDDRGALFRSHVDGSPIFYDPERAMAVQAELGSDIAMVLDHCPPSGAPRAQIVEALERTTRWAERCLRVRRPDHQARFVIVQGGLDVELRSAHIAELAQMGFEGIALGGLSVGESPEQMHAVLQRVAALLPEDKPRYLMGVGRPEDIVLAIGAGIDMFDCVLPTRNARTGQLFTRTGRVVIKNSRHRSDDRPIDPTCSCRVCARYSRAYLRHLYTTKEMLYSRLATWHNLHFMLELAREARRAVLEQRYADFAREFFAARQAAHTTSIASP